MNQRSGYYFINVMFGLAASTSMIGCSDAKDDRYKSAGNQVGLGTATQLGNPSSQGANSTPGGPTLNPNSNNGKLGGQNPTPALDTTSPTTPSPPQGGVPPTSPVGNTSSSSPSTSSTSGGSTQTPLPGTPPVAAVSLEDCNKQKLSWPAVANQKQPTKCGESLVDWCCTRAEVLARFPLLSVTIDGRFSQIIDKDQYVLYQCSFDPQGSPNKGPRYTFHMAKIVEPQTYYQTVFVNDALPINTGTVATCPAPVTTADLKKGTPLPPLPPSQGGASTPAPAYDTVIKPILDAKCGGSTCHSAGTTLGVTFDWSDPVKLKAANRTALVTMPPIGSGKTGLTPDELQKLTDFMAAK